MKQVVTRGIILSRTDFGEADRILNVLTPDHGKVRLMAKGVRKIKSKLAGGIELFSVSLITFIPGRGEIGTLISTRLEKHFGSIVGDINRTMLGYDILKLINRATEDMAGPEYFAALLSTLEALDDTELDGGLLQLWLYVHLLQLAGHAPNLRDDGTGQALTEDGTYGFDLDDMHFTPADNGRYTAVHIKLLRVAAGQRTPESLKQLRDVESVLPECLQLALGMAGRHLRV